MFWSPWFPSRSHNLFLLVTISTRFPECSISPTLVFWWLSVWMSCRRCATGQDETSIGVVSPYSDEVWVVKGSWSTSHWKGLLMCKVRYIAVMSCPYPFSMVWKSCKKIMHFNQSSATNNWIDILLSVKQSMYYFTFKSQPFNAQLHVHRASYWWGCIHHLE